MRNFLGGLFGIGLVLLSASVQAEHKSFLGYCQSPKLDPWDAKTLSALRRMVSESDCDKAWAKIKQLERVQFYQDEAGSLRVLSGLKRLQSIYLEDRGTRKFFPLLKGLPALKSLSLIHVEYEDMSRIGHLKHLESLTVWSHADPRRFNFLSKMHQLRELSLVDGALTHVEFMKTFGSKKTLETLSLRLAGLAN